LALGFNVLHADCGAVSDLSQRQCQSARNCKFGDGLPTISGYRIWIVDDFKECSASKDTRKIKGS